MTVLSAIQAASLKIGVTRPSLVYASTVREHQELADLANDCAKMIAYDSGHDWRLLKTLMTMTGTGAAASFDLPADYRRMLKTSEMRRSDAPNQVMTHVPDTNDWLALDLNGFMGLPDAWTLLGDEVQIRVGGSAYLGNTVTAKTYYLSSYYARNAGGTAKGAFDTDSDTFRIDEQLLKLALIYRWKQEKGQDYSEAMADFETAKAMLIGEDKGPSIIKVGTPRVPAGVTAAYPRALG